MLDSLEYSVTFPTTGRKLAQSINFQDGFGAITGPNEAGKSFIIEMVRWLLFGTKALRGTSDDYKTLTGALDFTVRGESYRVERKIDQARLFRGEDEVAVGIRPVNDKIVQILNFGIDVFDVACVANQGDIEKLGDMRPTERKRMVDSVIGLGVIEDLAKFAGDEATALKRRFDDLKTLLVEPVAPVEPEGYRPSAQIKDEIDTITAWKVEHDQLVGWLSAAPAPPEVPDLTIEQTVEELTPLVKELEVLQTSRQVLLVRLSELPDPSPYSDEELGQLEAAWDAYEAYQAQQQFLKLHPQPTLTEKEIKAAWKALKDHEVYNELAMLSHRASELEKDGSHTCPACSHNWPIASDDIAAINARIEALPKLKVMPPAPLKWTKAQVEDAERRLAAWDHEGWEAVRSALPADKPDLNRKQVQQARLANQQAGMREQLQAQHDELLEKILAMPNYQRMLADRRVEDAAHAKYEQQLARYAAWIEEANRKQARLGELKQLVEALPQLIEAREAARSFEIATAAYTKAKEAFDANMALATTIQSDAEEWTKAKTALTTLRALVKQHLVPSLNKVASHLIKGMTGGQRQSVVVDENFEVLVDGQALNTLSGSGKAVANLALRLGLGQVLTNNVFSVFIGDEIDASMDKDRAENTADVLQTLKSRISQILLVTHKYPSADYYISLGTNNEHQLA